LFEGWSEEHEGVRLEMVGDLLIAPQSDIPFGKTIRLGTMKALIYERVIENGYLAGIQAYKKHVETVQDYVVLTDHELTEMIDRLLPSGLSDRDVEVWRAHFVIGYVSAYTGAAYVNLDGWKPGDPLF
jgi:hypothetical protein